MNRKNKYRLLAYTVAAALTITASPSSGMTASAKKGSQVYYTTNGTFRLKKKLSGGKSKKITITKTTKLSLYAVSRGTKVTAKQLKNKKLKKNSAYASYTYKITSGTGSKLADSDYDFRYENCDTSSASVISTTTAGTTVQGGNSRP